MGRTATLVLALAVAACGTAGGLTPSTTSTTPPSSTTTALAETTTMTTTTTTGPCEGEPFVMEERAVRLIPGCEYRTSTFGVPMSITAPDGTWLNLPVEDPRVTPLGLDEDQDGDSEAKIVVLIFGSGTPDDAIQEVIAAVDANAADYEVSEPRTTVIGGLQAVSIDFATGEELGIDPVRDECTAAGEMVETRRLDSWIFQLVEVLEVQRLYGVPACKQSRVWVVDVDDTIVTIVAAVLQEERFDELMPIVEEFLQNNVTFGDSDG